MIMKLMRSKMFFEMSLLVWTMMIVMMVSWAMVHNRIIVISIVMMMFPIMVTRRRRHHAMVMVMVMIMIAMVMMTPMLHAMLAVMMTIIIMIMVVVMIVRMISLCSTTAALSLFDNKERNKQNDADFHQQSTTKGTTAACWLMLFRFHYWRGRFGNNDGIISIIIRFCCHNEGLCW
jgi:predicted membrane protein